MQKTKFGRMRSLDLGATLLQRCEVMHFQSNGRAHTHPETEIAICVSGSGAVYVDDEPRLVSPGQFVVVPPGVSHWMRPARGQTLAMLIVYQTEED